MHTYVDISCRNTFMGLCFCISLQVLLFSLLNTFSLTAHCSIAPHFNRALFFPTHFYTLSIFCIVRDVVSNTALEC